MINRSKNLDRCYILRLKFDINFLNTRKESIIKLVYKISLKILIFHSTHIIKSLHFNQFFTCIWFKLAWYSYYCCWDSSCWDISNQFLLSFNRIITNISQHYNSILIICQSILLSKCIYIFHWFIKTCRNGRSSTLKFGIYQSFQLLQICIIDKLAWNNCSSSIMKDN